MSTVVSLRGTSGSGKTHLARRLMELLPGEPHSLENDAVSGAGRTEGYEWEHGAGRRLRVVGRYNVASGGADRIDRRDHAFELVGEAAAAGTDVFFEGLLIANEVGRTVELARSCRLAVIGLTTPLEECLRAINARRQAKQPGASPVPLTKTTDKHRELERVYARLRAAGVEVLRLDREAAFEKVCELLGVER